MSRPPADVCLAAGQEELRKAVVHPRRYQIHALIDVFERVHTQRSCEVESGSAKRDIIVLDRERPVRGKLILNPSTACPAPARLAGAPCDGSTKQGAKEVIVVL